MKAASRAHVHVVQRAVEQVRFSASLVRHQVTQHDREEEVPRDGVGGRHHCAARSSVIAAIRLLRASPIRTAVVLLSCRSWILPAFGDSREQRADALPMPQFSLLVDVKSRPIAISLRHLRLRLPECANAALLDSAMPNIALRHALVVTDSDTTRTIMDSMRIVDRRPWVPRIETLDGNLLERRGQQPLNVPEQPRIGCRHQ